MTTYKTTKTYTIKLSYFITGTIIERGKNKFCWSVDSRLLDLGPCPEGPYYENLGEGEATSLKEAKKCVEAYKKYTE